MPTAQQKNAPDDRWFLISTADPNYATFKSECDTKHTTNSPGNRLSVAPRLDGLVALIKVAGAASWVPSAGVIITNYDPNTHGQAQVLVAGTDWTPASIVVIP